MIDSLLLCVYRRGMNLAISALLAATLVMGGMATVAHGQAKDDSHKPDKADPEKKNQTLPLNSVVLFNSGVGFFEHRAEINGTAEVDLQFNVDDINDLLKSMVLQDLGGGHISTVTYTSKDPVTKTLKTFSIDLTDNPTLAQILEQVRGERIEIEAPAKLKGTIIGLEKRKRKIGRDDEGVIEIDVLNLLTDDGLKSLPLEQLGSIKLLDDKLNEEFKQALTLLASSHDTDKKTVSLKFVGEGKRPVHVGYVQQAPIWKTSYRLVLGDKETPLLQGWAIVENTTEDDWQDVKLTLVSGRPISFVMNLYDPLYVNRPLVEPELFASLRPQKYDEDLSLREQTPENEVLIRRKLAAANGAVAGNMGGMALNAPAPAAVALGIEAKTWSLHSSELQAAVQTAAQAGDVGELFQYVINEPVSLKRQRSAMLAIVNGPVEAEKVSIFNSRVQPKHPLNGLKLKNTTELHLMQGPITVFDGGSYAGDAQINDLPPGSERLISYALDLDVEVAQQAKSEPEQITSVTITKGVLITKRKLHRRVEYTIKNSGSQAKKVLIEVPRDTNWTLLEPKKPDETTRDMYRFAVQAEPGKPIQLEIVEEQVVDQQLAVADMDAGIIQYYLNAKSVKEDIKKALQEVIARRQRLESIVVERQNLENQIRAISEEQTRIRENMSRLERNSELFTRYVKKFGEQEDQIEQFRTQIENLTKSETALREELAKYISNLKIE